MENIVYSDPTIRVMLDPDEIEGYIVHRRGTEDYIGLPRGTLGDIALAEMDDARLMLDQLLPLYVDRFEFPYASVISSLRLAHSEEESRIGQGAKRIRKDIESQSL